MKNYHMNLKRNIPLYISKYLEEWVSIFCNAEFLKMKRFTDFYFGVLGGLMLSTSQKL